jgi:hypothetical protein
MIGGRSKKVKVNPKKVEGRLVGTEFGTQIPQCVHSLLLKARMISLKHMHRLCLVIRTPTNNLART